METTPTVVCWTAAYATSSRGRVFAAASSRYCSPPRYRRGQASVCWKVAAAPARHFCAWPHVFRAYAVSASSGIPLWLLLASANASANGHTGLAFIAADVTSPQELGMFEHACANPPYHAADRYAVTGRLSPGSQARRSWPAPGMGRRPGEPFVPAWHADLHPPRCLAATGHGRVRRRRLPASRRPAALAKGRRGGKADAVARHQERANTVPSLARSCAAPARWRLHRRGRGNPARRPAVAALSRTYSGQNLYGIVADTRMPQMP